MEIKYEKITSADIDKIKQFDDIEKQRETLRQIRYDECYIFVNRGEAWYKLLSEEQKAELDKWYKDWRNVTDTFEIPQKPTWLK